MQYNSDLHHRKSIRIPSYDYSQEGWYFVTICTYQREKLFGEIINKNIKLNKYGNIAKQCWMEIPFHYPNVKMDEFIVMPNHVHGIINIFEKHDTSVLNVVGIQNFESLRVNKYQHIIPGSIGTIIRGFKTGVTKWFRKNTDIYIVWQRNYWEHVIRNENDLNRIRDYIISNPLKWTEDKYFF
ncbi:MAG TPA: hypothetical protein ENO27_01915 [Caldithrix sp.]|nr:hypothetical protein [Caldithrix sp.]